MATRKKDILGRPRKAIPSKQELEDICRLSATQSEAAEWLGVSKPTLRNWRKVHGISRPSEIEA